MDWLDEQLLRLKEKGKALSLRKSLTLYIMNAIVIVIILYALTMNVCDNWYELLEAKHGIHEIVSTEGTIYYNYYDGSSIDRIIVNTLEFTRSWSIIIYSLLAIIITSICFYNHKIKEPLYLLTEQARHISNNDLTFECRYDSNDELGDLCLAFDKMRISLIDNNKMMWQMMEEQKRLNAAFAHDLRTPLTVLHGYMDLLMNYYPQGKISEEKLLETLGSMKGNLIRLEKFGDSMREINKLEDIKIHKEETNITMLQALVEYTIHIMKETYNLSIECKVVCLNKEKTLHMDRYVFMEVFDNVLSNAIRFAINKISINIELDDKGRLLLYIKDDGIGFPIDDIKNLTKPYYTNENKDSKEHVGIGLTIAEILCKKHGGYISFSNSTEGGAIVTANFSVI